MKKGTKIAAVMMIGGILFLLSSCGTKKYKLQEKYVAIYDEDEYCEFSKDGTYSLGSKGYDPRTGTYLFNEGRENELRLIDDEIAEGFQFVGEVYEDYLCTVWNGRLPKKYEDTRISYVDNRPSARMYASCHFHEDGTYDFLVYKEDYDTKNRELYLSKEGTYEVEKGKVDCANNDGSPDVSTATYFTADDKIYGIWYVAE